MKQELSDLLDLLDLEQIEVNMFRGVSPAEGWQRVYGGQVIGQALVAASRTVEDQSRIAHSLHGYFLRPGDTKIPIVYSVDRIRDGNSFNTRRVVAIQRGKAIFSMSVSFQVIEDGPHHQMDMPAVNAPEDCRTESEIRADYIDQIPEEYRASFTRPRPIEMRFQDAINDFNPDPMPPHQNVWIRAIDTMPDDIRLNQCLLAYASDMTLMDTALRPHGIGWTETNFQGASLDHSMWFHAPFKTDEWLLYSQDSPYSGGARGFNRGSFFTRDGKLIASATQEGLMRLHTPQA
ncbi:MAG: acyl-CoA thioesterase II [Gammaproteobacteria bacterium]|jgi:acyl-CoA thioesterase II|nr:acyl-CoA thioesterase II [Gammaproteobacteria bacterium]MBT4492206.1 acyl-CoA thioesterase II [Gammaproteobacteria bacterium]MBT7369407.1 acyl-CoA thioesterase II [Gammaproteobacteria bacterium]